MYFTTVNFTFLTEKTASGETVFYLLFEMQITAEDQQQPEPYRHHFLRI